MISLIKKIFTIFVLSSAFINLSYSKESVEEKIQKIIYDSISSYSGKCACPYQMKANNTRCGKNSAYSKPGGAEPICYPSDVTSEVIEAFDKKNNSQSSLNINGKSKVIDGDTIKIGKLSIRLHGIDAPESKQTCIDSKNKIYPCGYQSTMFLKSLIKKNYVLCEGKDKDRYGRVIAICYSNEINLNSTMVSEGWAIAYRYYSKDYVNEEKTAKINRLGIWQGEFTEPYIWRKKN